METLAFNPNLIKSELTQKVKRIPYVQSRIRKVEKFKVVHSTISRRVKALESEGWIKKSGERPVSLFEGAKTWEYALSDKGIIAIFLESQKVQDDFPKVLKINMNHSEDLRSIQQTVNSMTFLEKILPKSLFQKYCIKPMENYYSRMNLANQPNESLQMLFSEMFLYTTCLLIDSEELQKDFRSHLGRHRYGPVKRKLRRNLSRVLKPHIPTLKLMKMEHEKQAKQLGEIIEAVEKTVGKKGV